MIEETISLLENLREEVAVGKNTVDLEDQELKELRGMVDELSLENARLQYYIKYLEKRVRDLVNANIEEPKSPKVCILCVDITFLD